jgi:murein DD-endopeptidase MepM/ murein hydrolase activator NlpD
MKFILSPTGTVTSEWGSIDKYHPYGHKGIDFACKTGNPIHSLTNGIVDKIVNTPKGVGLGNGIFIKTDQGYQFIYGHLIKITVKVGEVVDKGDIIGLCGASGRSFGSHLHLSVINTIGRYIDPQEALKYIKTFADGMTNVVLEVFKAVIF